MFAKESGQAIKDAYTGDNIDEMKIKQKDLTLEIDKSTAAVNKYGDATEGAYAKSTEALEKERKEREKAETAKQKLLFDVMESGQQKELEALEKNYVEKKILFEKIQFKPQ